MKGVLGAKAPNKRIWETKFSACCNTRQLSCVEMRLRLTSDITSRKERVGEYKYRLCLRRCDFAPLRPFPFLVC